jgi:UDP-N-acetylglucosamine acyltransferase
MFGSLGVLEVIAPRTRWPMPSAPFPRIHPSAIISAEADLADDVVVGPMVVIEGKVRVGSGCILRPHCQLIGTLTLGKNNTVFGNAVLGERPQHFRYADEPTAVEIGDNNIFREGVTIHRATTHSWVTRIGSDNFFMANSHVAHDCQVGSRCIFANGALLGGHCVIGDGVYLSGNAAAHQFVRIGRLALLSGCSTTTKDIPPFVIQQGRNAVAGVNVIGMRRAGISNDEIRDVRASFHILFRSGLATPNALQQIEQEFGTSPAVMELVHFIRQSSHRGGINSIRDRDREREREAA